MFDFDGTLADSFPWFVGIVNHLAQKYAFKPIEASEIETLRGYDARTIVRQLDVPVWKMPMIARYLRNLMARDIGRIRLFDGVDRLLRRLAEQGVTMAVVSSNSTDNVRRVLGPENAALIRYYECGVALFGKEAKLRNVLAKSGVPRGEALYIGDEIRDLEAARNERIAFGAVSWGYTRPDALAAHTPDLLFATVEDIV